MEYSLQCGPAASPLFYELNGKLPAGLKFDAKAGGIAGVPTKAGKASVTIVATTRASISKSLTVNIEIRPLPEWLVGDYRGMLAESRWNDYGNWDDDGDWISEGGDEKGPSEGLLELAVTSAGKVSAKVLTRAGSRSLSGNLEWRDPEAEYYSEDDDDEYDEDESSAEFRFWHTDEKDESYCHVGFYEDGTVDGYVDSYYKAEDGWIGGDMTGMRQDKALFAKSNFVDKYYTFAFCAETLGKYDDGNYDNDGEDWEGEEASVKSGYGYLTLKTDKKGTVKVVGQLPDGEKVSASALVMPMNDGGDENPVADDISARLYVFASPSSYKNAGWFAMSLVVMSDGTINSEEGAAWTISVPKKYVCYDPYEYDYYDPSTQSDATVCGVGALYSEAKTLEGFYWNVFCAWSDRVQLEYSWKEKDTDSDRDRLQNSEAVRKEKSQGKAECRDARTNGQRSKREAR